MISRYSRPEMANIWGLENKYQIWLKVELLACEAYGELGLIPESSLKTIKEKAEFSLPRMEELERVTHHDVEQKINWTSVQPIKILPCR